MQVQTYATEKLLSDKTQAVVERDRQLSDTQHLSVLRDTHAPRIEHGPSGWSARRSTTELRMQL